MSYEEGAGMSERAQALEAVRGFTVHICDDCLHLRGEMCHEPNCRFCRRTMAEVAEYLNVLLIRPVIDGVGVIVDYGQPVEAPAVGVSPQPDEQYRKVLNALGEFYSMVRGECPSLLEDDLNAFEAWSVLDDAKWFDSPELLPASLSPVEPTPPAEDEDDDEVPVARAEGAPDAWSAPLRKPVVPKIPHVETLRQMVGMAGTFRQTLLTVRECIDALTPGHRTGYDWNADPLYMTRYVGDALKAIDDGLKSLSRVEPTPEPTCPHCKLPRVLPEECPPELNAVIEAQIAERWDVLNSGYDLGKRHGRESVEPAPPTPAPCVWCITNGPLGNWVTPSCIAESIPAPWGAERAVTCYLCGSALRITR